MSTVGELRALIKDLPDDTPVLLGAGDEGYTSGYLGKQDLGHDDEYGLWNDRGDEPKVACITLEDGR